MKKLFVVFFMSVFLFSCNKSKIYTNNFIDITVREFREYNSYHLDEMFYQLERDYQENPQKVEELHEKCNQIRTSLISIEDLQNIYNLEVDPDEFFQLANEHWLLLKEVLDYYDKDIDLSAYKNEFFYSKKELSYTVLLAGLEFATYKVIKEVTYNPLKDLDWSDLEVFVILNNNVLKLNEFINAEISIFSVLTNQPLFVQINGKKLTGSNFVEYSQVLSEIGSHIISGKLMIENSYGDTIFYPFIKQINVTQ